MSRRVEEMLGELFAAAEERGSCLALEAGTAEARALQRALERRVGKGTVVSPARGLYARAGTWKAASQDVRTLLLARSLQGLHPDWVFCGPTAAVAYGVDVSWSLQDRIHVATTRAGHRAAGPVVCRHALLGEADSPEVGVVGGIRVTDPIATVCDCLRAADFPCGLGIADSALRLGLVDRGALAERLGSARGRADARERALATLGWADPRSENGGESKARAHMLLLGYACPELQVEVPRLVGGGEPFRADFCWARTDGVVILGELEGTDKYVVKEMTRGRSLDEVLADERVRGSRISLYDVSVMRFRYGLCERPEAFAALLDEYGVPKRGSGLACPAGVHVLPDWERLRRHPEALR